MASVCKISEPRPRSAGVYGRESLLALGVVLNSAANERGADGVTLKEVALPSGHARPTKSARSRVKQSRCSKLTLESFIRVRVAS